MSRPDRAVAERAEHERRADHRILQQLADLVAEHLEADRPAVVFRTISAKRNCRPRPQATTRGLMARRLVDNATRSPESARARSAAAAWSAQSSTAPSVRRNSVRRQRATHARTSGTAGGGGRSRSRSPLRQARRPRPAAVHRCSEARASARPATTRSPGFFCTRMPARRIDRSASTRSRPAPSSIDARPTSSASSARQISVGGGGHHSGVRGARQPRRIANDTRRRLPAARSIASNFASAAPDDSASRTMRSASSSSAARPASTTIRAGQPDDHLFEIRRALALQRLDALDDLERVADGAAERRVHRRDEGLGSHPVGGADRHERPRQRQRVVVRLHERAAAALHVEHHARRCPRRSSCSSPTPK